MDRAPVEPVAPGARQNATDAKLRHARAAVKPPGAEAADYCALWLSSPES